MLMPWTKRKRRRARALGFVERSGLFDPEWYRKTTGGSAAASESLGAFLKQPWAIHSEPHPCFWPGFYRSWLTEGRRVPGNPLAHYAEEGWRRGFWPNPVFDPVVYLENNPDLKEVSIEPLRHYLEHGWKEGRIFHPSFEVEAYRKMFPMMPVGMSPLEHFLRDGWRTQPRRGRKRGGSGMFDEWMIAIARWRLGDEDAETLRSLQKYLDPYQQMERRTMEWTEWPAVRFSVAEGEGLGVLETVNALTRQMGGPFRIVIDKKVRFSREEARRLRILAARRPGCAMVLGETSWMEHSATEEGIRVFLDAGVCPMPETTVLLADAFQSGDPGGCDLEGLFTGSGRIAAVFYDRNGSGATSGEIWRRTVEAGSNSCPLAFREYFFQRDPAFWTLHDFSSRVRD